MVAVRVFGTPVKVQVSVLPDLLIVWGGVTWWGIRRHPGRSLWQGVLVGLASWALLLTTDFGHALAHILSARLAGAPMDEVLISAGMPRTLYSNNDVSPVAHRIRALGGPLYNLICLSLGLPVYVSAPGNSVARELAGWFTLGHGAQLVMSLAPVPVVDGGTILKWTLVARGKTPAEADRVIRRVDWAMAAAGGAIGLGLLARRKWVPGLVAAGLGPVVTGIAAGKIR